MLFNQDEEARIADAIRAGVLAILVRAPAIAGGVVKLKVHRAPAVGIVGGSSHREFRPARAGGQAVGHELAECPQYDGANPEPDLAPRADRCRKLRAQ